MALMSLSRVTWETGIGGGPTPFSLTRSPQNGWSPKNGMIVVGHCNCRPKMSALYNIVFIVQNHTNKESFITDAIFIGLPHLPCSMNIVIIQIMKLSDLVSMQAIKQSGSHRLELTSLTTRWHLNDIWHWQHLNSILRTIKFSTGEGEGVWCGIWKCKRKD